MIKVMRRTKKDMRDDPPMWREPVDVHRSNKQKRAAEFAEHRDRREDEDDLEHDSE